MALANVQGLDGERNGVKVVWDVADAVAGVPGRSCRGRS